MSDEQRNEPRAASLRRNVEIVRGVYEAFGRRDMVAAFAVFAPDVELRQSDEVPWGGHYVGIEKAQEFFARLTGAVSSSLVLQQFVDAGDHVVAIGRTQGTVNSGGAPFDVPIAHVWQVKDGRVVRVCFHIDNPTMRAALRASGAIT